MAVALTYNSLVTNIQGYAERTDVAFTAQIPTLVMLGEQKIAAECRGLGFITSVTDNLIPGANGSALQKPALWRETISLTIGTGTPPNTKTAPYNYRQRLKLRLYEYCRQYAPDPTLLDTPVYYSDWDWAHYLIAPSPDLAYPYELLFHQRPQPLDAGNQTNWTTQYAPQLLLFACLLEASAWVKNKALIDTWEKGYTNARAQVEFEATRRISDRAQGSPPPQQNASAGR